MADPARRSPASPRRSRGKRHGSLFGRRRPPTWSCPSRQLRGHVSGHPDATTPDGGVCCGEPSDGLRRSARLAPCSLDEEAAHHPDGRGKRSVGQDVERRARLDDEDGVADSACSPGGGDERTQQDPPTTTSMTSLLAYDLPYLSHLDSISADDESAGSDAVTKPLLPAADAAGQLREVAFALLLRDRRPIETSVLAAATGLHPDAIRDTVCTLAGAGWLRVVVASRERHRFPGSPTNLPISVRGHCPEHRRGLSSVGSRDDHARTAIERDRLRGLRLPKDGRGHRAAWP